VTLFKFTEKLYRSWNWSLPGSRWWRLILVILASTVFDWFTRVTDGRTATLMSAFVLSKLDYCNTILAGLPKSTIAPLQRAQNAAARLIGLVASRDYVTSTLQQLHWLPVQYRIIYKLCLLMHLIHTSQAPSYLTDIVTQTASVTPRTRLRSGSSLRYEQPRTRLKFGQRAFSYAAPAAWNSLPPSLQELGYLTLRHLNET